MEKLKIQKREPKKLKIFILSNSRSLYSTKRLFEEIVKREHHGRVYPPIDLTMSIGVNKNRIFHDNRIVPTPDWIIPRFGQKKPSYTLSVFRQFEIMGAKSLNASISMSRSRDKLRSLQILTKAKINIPQTYYLDALSDIDLLLKMIKNEKVIIKLIDGTQGVGVMLAESKMSAKSILESVLSQGQHVIVQEFIEESAGEDKRAIILGGRLIAAMKRKSITGDFRSNIHRGGSHEKVTLSIEAERMAVHATKILDLDFAGVDIVESDRGPLILEVNSSPGLEGIEKTTEINIAEKIVTYIERVHYHKSKEEKTF